MDSGPGRPEPLDEVAVRRGLGKELPVGRLVVLAETASTSTHLADGVRSDPSAWPDRSLVVADHQAAGRGRAGRVWTTPPGTALTMSVLLRPQVGLNRFGWVPLIAGLAVVRALAEVSSAEAVLKWPNDVLVASDEDDLPGWGRHRKVAGILGDLVMTQEGPVVVVGIGVNVSQSADELPVTSATSLALMTLGHGGAAPERTEVLAAVTRHLFALDSRWRDASGDAWGAGLGAEISAACATIGQVVRVEMPGGEVLDGTATGLTADGALVLRDVAGRVRSVLAGDVRHVRTAPD